MDHGRQTMDAARIAEVVRLGQTEPTSTGRTALRVVIRLTVAPDTQPRLDALRAALMAQLPALVESVAVLGAEMVPDSLNALGQMLELRVPLDRLADFEAEMSRQGRVTELVMPRRMNDP